MKTMLKVLIVSMLMTAASMSVSCDKEPAKKSPGQKETSAAKKVVADETEPVKYFYEISAGAKNIYIGKDYQWKVLKIDAETGEKSEVKAAYSSEDPKVLEISSDGLAKGITSEYTAVSISFEGLKYRAEVLVLDPSDGEPADGGIGLQNPVYMTPELLMHSWLIREEVRGSDKYIEVYIGLENLGDESVSFDPKEFQLIDEDGKTYDTIPPEPDPESNPDAYNEISNTAVIKGDMNFGEVAFRLPAAGPPPSRFKYTGEAGSIAVDYQQLIQTYK